VGSARLSGLPRTGGSGRIPAGWPVSSTAVGAHRTVLARSPWYPVPATGGLAAQVTMPRGPAPSAHLDTEWITRGGERHRVTAPAPVNPVNGNTWRTVALPVDHDAVLFRLVGTVDPHQGWLAFSVPYQPGSASGGQQWRDGGRVGLTVLAVLTLL